MNLITRIFAGFCIATVLTQLLIVTVLAARGSLNGDSGTKIVGLMNGIDISGDRVAEKIRDAQTQPIPSFEEVLEARAREGLQMDLRRRSQENFYSQMQVIQERLRSTESQFDTRKDAFYRKVDELKQGDQDENMLTVVKTMESLPPLMAKDQIIRMLEESDLNDAVAIVKAMSEDKRKKVFREFVSPEEADKLQEIIRQMGEGGPLKNLIDEAQTE